MRLGLVIAAVLIAAIAVVGFVYAFGVPQQGGVAASSAAPPSTGEAAPAESWAGSVVEEPTERLDDAKVPADAVAPPADPSVPLAIEIPGCVCHSDDPQLVKQHAAYRMNQCAGCHVGGVPTGQE